MVMRGSIALVSIVLIVCFTVTTPLVIPRPDYAILASNPQILPNFSNITSTDSVLSFRRVDVDITREGPIIGEAAKNRMRELVNQGVTILSRRAQNENFERLEVFATRYSLHFIPVDSPPGGFTNREAGIALRRVLNAVRGDPITWDVLGLARPLRSKLAWGWLGPSV